MELNLEELKKNHNTSYLAGILERLNKEEQEVRDMLKGDSSLQDMADTELKSIQEQKDATEKQIEDILNKEKEEDGLFAGHS